MGLNPPPVPASRMLPPLDERNRPFWTGGHDGRLLIERCRACGRWQHPPAGRCAECGGDAAPTPASGRGTVFTYTVDEHQFHPDVPPPYVIALVELEEQAGLRIMGNIVGCDEGDLRIDLPVRVAFETHGEYAVPVWAPAAGGR